MPCHNALLSPHLAAIARPGLDRPEHGADRDGKRWLTAPGVLWRAWNLPARAVSLSCAGDLVAKGGASVVSVAGRPYLCPAGLRRPRAGSFGRHGFHLRHETLVASLGLVCNKHVVKRIYLLEDGG